MNISTTLGVGNCFDLPTYKLQTCHRQNINDITLVMLHDKPTVSHPNVIM